MKRIPRPQGLTNILNLYNNKQIDKENVLQYIVRIYVQSNYTIDGTFYTLLELSNILNTPDSILQRYINKYYENMETIGQTQEALNSQMAWARGVQKMALNLALEGTHFAREQLLTLRFSQNGQYQPFISKEVNSAIKIYADSTKTIAEMAKGLQPSQPTISILNQQGIAVAQHAALGPLEAMKLIEAKMTETMGFEIGSEGHIHYLINSPALIQGLPEVVATSNQEQELMALEVAKKASKADELSDLDIRSIHKFQDSILDEDDITEAEEI